MLTIRGGEKRAVGVVLALALSIAVSLALATSADGLFYEPLGVGELVSHGSGVALGTVRLTLGANPGEFVSAAAPFARLQLGADTKGHRPLMLTLDSVDVSIPAACQQLPASDTLATPQFELDTTVSLSDGQTTHTVSLPGVWHCVRNAAGAVSELETVAPEALSQRPGLNVSLAGPDEVTAGQTVTYRIRVRNTRRGTNPASSSLWHLFIRSEETTAPPGAEPLQSSTRRLAELRRGKSRTIVLRAQIPRDISGSVCVATVVSADAAIPASARSCPAVRPSPVRRRR